MKYENIFDEHCKEQRKRANKRQMGKTENKKKMSKGTINERSKQVVDWKKIFVMQKTDNRTCIHNI